MKKPIIHKSLAAIHIKSKITRGTACRMENSTYIYASAEEWKLVTCKKCLAFKKKYGL